MVHGPYHPPSGGLYHPKIMSPEILNSYRQRVDKYYLYSFVFIHTFHALSVATSSLLQVIFFNDNRSTKVVKSYKKMSKKRKYVFIF